MRRKLATRPTGPRRVSQPRALPGGFPANWPSAPWRPTSIPPVARANLVRALQRRFAPFFFAKAVQNLAFPYAPAVPGPGPKILSDGGTFFVVEGGRFRQPAPFNAVNQTFSILGTPPLSTVLLKNDVQWQYMYDYSQWVSPTQKRWWWSYNVAPGGKFQTARQTRPQFQPNPFIWNRPDDAIALSPRLARHLYRVFRGEDWEVIITNRGVRVRIARPTKNGPEVIEKKYGAKYLPFWLAFFANAITETLDIWEALVKAAGFKPIMPRHWSEPGYWVNPYQGGTFDDVQTYPGWVAQSLDYMLSGGWKNIEGDELLKNLLKNAAEDAVIGRLSQAMQRNLNEGGWKRKFGAGLGLAL